MVGIQNLGIEFNYAAYQQDMKAIISPGKLLCLWQTHKIMQHMYCNIPNVLNCWAAPVVNLLLLKSSMLYGSFY